MLKSLGRSIFTFFARPAPTSVALMVGGVPGVAANDDQSQLLRRAMQAASAAERADVELPDEPVHVEPATDAGSSDEDKALAEADGELETSAEEATVEEAAPSREMFAAWEELTAPDLPLLVDELADDAPLREPSADVVIEAAEAAEAAEAVEDEDASDEPVQRVDAIEDVQEPVDIGPLAVADVVASEPSVSVEEESFLPIAEQPVDPSSKAAAEALAEPPPEDVVEDVALDVAREDSGEEAAAAVEVQPAEDEPEAKPRKKRAPAKKKAAKPSRKAKVAVDAPAERVPEDDVWVSDAVAWSLSGEWSDGAWSPPDGDDCPRRLEELREAAAEGRLTIWGRSNDAGVWQPIDAAYWKSGKVEPDSLTQGREKVVAELKAAKAKGKAKAAQKFSALKVSRAQIEELWRPDAMH